MVISLKLVVLVVYIINLNSLQCNAETNLNEIHEKSSFPNLLRAKCDSIEFCQKYGDFNLICVNLRCQLLCDINYKFNQTNRKCEFKPSYSTEDCQYYDPNRICSNNLCYCSHDYIEDKYSFSKDCIRKTPIEKDCNNLSDCGLNQFCANNVCECQPNYEYNATINSCEFKLCESHMDCDRFDSNRECYVIINENNTLNGHCICKSYLAPDPKTKFCNVTVGMSCIKNFDCTKYGDNNQVCVDNICQCIPNYRMDYRWNACNTYSCSNDSECQQYDKHRICDFLCICESGYSENSLNKICYHTHKRSWLWMLFTIPGLVLFMVILRVYRTYIYCTHQSNQDIDSPPTYTEAPLSIISQDARFNDPPPAYSTNYINPCQPIQSNHSPNHLQNVDDPPPPYSIK